jgi:hypothetical protein
MYTIFFVAFCILLYCDMTPESGYSGAKVAFIARQRLVKQIPAEMNTHVRIKELPFLCNGELNTPR